MTRFPIQLDDKTASALFDLAKSESRSLPQQAEHLIKQELIRLGVLPVEWAITIDRPKNPVVEMRGRNG